jgi:hypothetical protein
MVDQYPAHRLGSSAKKVSTALPVLVTHSDQTKPSLMNQRSRLECMAGSFMSHIVAGEFTQFLIDKRKEFFRGLCITLLDCIEDACDVVHAALFNSIAAWPGVS